MAKPQRPPRNAVEPTMSRSGDLASWAAGQARPAAFCAAGGLRFASYGRCSTQDRQDPVLSKRWQDSRAQAVIAGEGRVVRAFFDEGHSRQKAWQLRPAAAELIAALKDPDRGFDAVVIGSHERAFCGNQFSLIAPLFQKYGVQLWLPELGGPVDWNLIGHDELLTVLGMVAKREIVKIRARTTAAMTALVRDFGRYVGGRPPYGYRLVDAGPHPNQRDARWGRRLLKLQADPQTAPTVTWIFRMRLCGKSVARVARALNEQDIPCPSAADRERNLHRSGEAWQVPAVSAILANPVYTGHAVWNRQFNAHPLVDEDDLALGRCDAQRWNSPDQWIISTRIVHDVLVTEEDFIAVQGMRAKRTDAKHTYLLTGLLTCSACGRRMEGAWSNGCAAYRCRHGLSSAAKSTAERVRNAFVKESHVLARLALLHTRLNAAEARGTEPSTTSATKKTNTTARRPEEVIDYLRVHALTLAYHHETRTLEAKAEQPVRVTL